MTTTTPIQATHRRLMQSGNLKGALAFGIDLIAPTALFYLLVSWGMGLYVALLASAGLSAVTGLAAWVRGNRRSGANFMLLVTLAGLAIAFISGSDRFMLARESVLTALAGVWFLLSIRGDQPLTFRFTRPLWEGRLHSNANWDQLWATNPTFRHIWRVSSVMWGVATLLDAALRVVIAYSLPIKSVVLAQTGLMIATMLMMQVVTNVYYVRAGLWSILRPSRPA